MAWPGPCAARALVVEVKQRVLDAPAWTPTRSAPSCGLGYQPTGQVLPVANQLYRRLEHWNSAVVLDLGLSTALFQMLDGGAAEVEHQFAMDVGPVEPRLVHRTARIRLRVTRHQADRCLWTDAHGR